jgi:lipopolysaccharide/colanic/teichoic acid biosynthesis glycosyltransferase
MMRFFDILFSAIAIIILFPFMLPIMIALKCTGEHDIFYLQERIGKKGKPFKMIKFATMMRDSPKLSGGLITAPNDPRLLPMGKFLRKTKINEIPQILYIFSGQMSIVGYRPFTEEHYNLYSKEVKKQISSIRPGLTGVGSIVFRDEEELLHSVSDRDYFHDEVITPYKGELECWYIQNQTLKNYFLIIICTILVLFNLDKRNIWQKLFKNLPEIPPKLNLYLIA